MRGPHRDLRSRDTNYGGAIRPGRARDKLRDDLPHIHLAIGKVRWQLSRDR